MQGIQQYSTSRGGQQGSAVLGPARGRPAAGIKTNDLRWWISHGLPLGSVHARATRGARNCVALAAPVGLGCRSEMAGPGERSQSLQPEAAAESPASPVEPGLGARGSGWRPGEPKLCEPASKASRQAAGIAKLSGSATRLGFGRAPCRAVCWSCSWLRRRLATFARLFAASWVAHEAGATLIVANLDYEYARWGTPLEARVARCHVSLTATSFFIRTLPFLPLRTLVMPAYGTSPHCPTNYVTAFGPGPDGKYQYVIVDRHPSRYMVGLFPQLARLAYVDIGYFIPSFSTNDYFYLHLPELHYAPEELRLDIRFDTAHGSKPAWVAARTPGYVKAWRNADGAWHKVPLSGGASSRRLWEFAVEAWTNVHGRFFPLAFTFVEYPPVQSRIEREDLTPVTRCRGRLLEVASGGEERLQDYLADHLKVYDARALGPGEVGAPTYEVSNGVWLAEGSAPLIALARSNQLRRRPQEPIESVPAGSRHWYWVGVGALSLVPVLVMSRRLIRRRLEIGR